MLILRWILQFDLAEHVKIIPIMDARGAGRGLRAGVGITRSAGKFALRHAGRAAIAAAAIAAATAVITRGTAAVAAVTTAAAVIVAGAAVAVKAAAIAIAAVGAAAAAARSRCRSVTSNTRSANCFGVAAATLSSSERKLPVVIRQLCDRQHRRAARRSGCPRP